MNVDCEDGHICRDGECANLVGTFCIGHADCGPAMTCQQNKCQLKETEALCNCQSNEICQHGQCYPNDECAYVHCEQGFYCIHGQCSNAIGLACEDGNCHGGTICVNNVCVADPCLNRMRKFHLSLFLLLICYKFAEPLDSLPFSKPEVAEDLASTYKKPVAIVEKLEVDEPGEPLAARVKYRRTTFKRKELEVGQEPVDTKPGNSLGEPQSQNSTASELKKQVDTGSQNSGRDSSVLDEAEGSSSDEPEYVFEKPIEVIAEEQSITSSKKIKIIESVKEEASIIPAKIHARKSKRPNKTGTLAAEPLLGSEGPSLDDFIYASGPSINVSVDDVIKKPPKIVQDESYDSVLEKNPARVSQRKRRRKTKLEIILLPLEGIEGPSSEEIKIVFTPIEEETPVTEYLKQPPRLIDNNRCIDATRPNPGKVKERKTKYKMAKELKTEELLGTEGPNLSEFYTTTKTSVQESRLETKPDSHGTTISNVSESEATTVATSLNAITTPTRYGHRKLTTHPPWMNLDDYTVNLSKEEREKHKNGIDKLSVTWPDLPKTTLSISVKNSNISIPLPPDGTEYFNATCKYKLVNYEQAGKENLITNSSKDAKSSVSKDSNDEEEDFADYDPTSARVNTKKQEVWVLVCSNATNPTVASDKPEQKRMTKAPKRNSVHVAENASEVMTADTKKLGLICQKAEKLCSKMKAHLTSIESEEENYYVSSLTNTTTSTDEKSLPWLDRDAKVWSWLDGKKAGFVNWPPNKDGTNSAFNCITFSTQDTPDKTKDGKDSLKWKPITCVARKHVYVYLLGLVGSDLEDSSVSQMTAHGGGVDVVWELVGTVDFATHSTMLTVASLQIKNNQFLKLNTITNFTSCLQ
ncbi:hypothetical protein WR25_00191 [Diploscapter pachys]|uniref:C-type lectin domain-containing protein n=1 Tax=Diploscapter pachys TaxID=2018661 RepID=A0A2A2J3T1_9BILA|nr:hypothetical protein WR25_00191 [Diploscapter pachys]